MNRGLIAFAMAAMAVMAAAETAGLRANARQRVTALSALKRVSARTEASATPRMRWPPLAPGRSLRAARAPESRARIASTR